MSLIIAGLDIKPLPDGTVRFTFDATDEMVDRLAAWNVSADEFEDDEREDGGLREDDERDLPRVTEPEPQALQTVVFGGSGAQVVRDDLSERRVLREIRTVCAKLLVDLKAGALPPPAPLPATFAAVFEVRNLEAA